MLSYMKLSHWLVAPIAALALTGCASTDRGWLDAPLKDTAWQLVTIESSTNNAGRDYVANKAEVVMTLDANGDADLTLGCEQGSMSWEASWELIETQGEIRFEGLEITAPDSPCEPNPVVQRVLKDIEFFQGYVLIQNHLYLNTRANAATYGWRKIEPQQ